MLGQLRGDALIPRQCPAAPVALDRGPRHHHRRPTPTAASLQHQDLGAPSSSASFYKKGLVIPSQLLGPERRNAMLLTRASERSQAENQQQTVYTVRLSTGFERGSGLDEPYAGVQLCLVGQDGRAILHRISPVFDAHALVAELEAIRRVVDNSVGANRNAIAQAHDRIEALPEGKRRFQPGSVDEISFLGPELGPLQSLLVAPEEGSWRLEEASVSSSRTRHTDRFVSGDLLGVKGGAGFLAAVPPDAVVYGSGESTVILSRAQAQALHNAGMGKYSLFKARLLQTNLSLVSLGTSLAWAFAGEDVAVHFACGGAGGLLYQWLLQKGVDGMSLDTPPLYHKARGSVPGDAIGKVLGSGAFRVALVGFFVFCAIYGSRLKHPGAAQYHPSQVQEILVGIAGFLMYKVSLVGVLAVPPLLQWDQPQEN